jgi:peptidoglycan-N-acetylglucosamine deacetylase
MRAIRRIESAQDSVFLTFDDGPCETGTPAVLDVLKRHGAHATFFVVADQAEKHIKIIERIQAEGHTIGDHSLDHTYRYFFAPENTLANWVLQSRTKLASIGVRSVGYRPPAGIVTPPLKRVLQALDEPLILWNVRFYDAIWKWRTARALRSARTMPAGSVVLLHDRGRARSDGFYSTLDKFLGEIGSRGLKFEPLKREICQQGELL